VNGAFRFKGGATVGRDQINASSHEIFMVEGRRRGVC